MIFFILLLIELLLLSTSRGQDLNESSKFTNEHSVVRKKSNLTDFMFTLSNSSEFVASYSEPKQNQVDCFGLGHTVAVTLEWFFMNQPNGTNALDVRFLLSSRRQPRRVQVIIGEQFGLEWTDFQIDRRTVIIVHGFLSHGGESWITDMERAFLQWGDVNVVVVDWSSGGNTWNYYKAAVNTRVVGYQIARFLEHVENATVTRGIDAYAWGPLHFIGHSLGAHICGFAAKELKRKSSRWTVERITGLDPAQPCFRNADSAVKLHKSDAPFVDVIHTNGRLLSQMGLGLPEPIGHVDFYPNGGRSQPGCLRIDSMYYQYLPIPVQSISKSICSHGRSYVYLTESLVSDAISNCTFWARYWDLTYRNLIRTIAEPCDRDVCTEMGINAINHPQRGTFFVSTSDSVPFCINSTLIIEEVKTELEKDHFDDLKD